MARAKPTISQRNARTRANTIKKIETTRTNNAAIREQNRTTNAAAREQNRTASIAARNVDVTTQRAVQEGIHERHRVTTESELGGVRRNQQLSNRAGNAVISTATPSDDSNLIMTVMFVMAGLVVVYILVSNPKSTGFLGGLGTTLHTISSNKPLFVSTAK